MQINVILTNKRRTHAQSNYTDTKLKVWFRRVLRHPARKRSGPILHPERTRLVVQLVVQRINNKSAEVEFVVYV